MLNCVSVVNGHEFDLPLIRRRRSSNYRHTSCSISRDIPLSWRNRPTCNICPCRYNNGSRGSCCCVAFHLERFSSCIKRDHLKLRTRVVPSLERMSQHLASC